MTAADLRKRVTRFDMAALHLHVQWRMWSAIGNAFAANLAKENRDIARRAHLEAFADELLNAPQAVS